MNKLIFYVFLLYSLQAEAQVSDDSLKDVCKDLYQSQINNTDSLKKYNLAPASHLEIDEIFHGYFKGLRLFLVGANFPHKQYGLHFHSPYITELYILNAETGKELKVGGVEEFNRIFGNCSKLCNLDRCYLYLFIVAKETGRITRPNDYRNVLNSNSVYKKDSLTLNRWHAFGTIVKPYPLRSFEAYEMVRAKIHADLSQSDKDDIYVFAESKEIIYRYEFIFTKDGKITKVIKASLKWPE